MVLDEAMIVAGIGSRKGVTADEVLAAVDAALAAYGMTRGSLDRLATAAVKQDEPALAAAGFTLGLDLDVVGDAGLAAASNRALTRSQASMDKVGVPSVSEAAALAAAGPDSCLLGPRVVLGAVTCAIAVSGAAP